MARSFAVTAPSDQVQLDKDGKGGAVFTVTNASARVLEGRASVAPKDPSHKPWLTILGEANRKFAPSATEQYTVQIAVPTGSQTVTVAFGLNVVAEDRPDEDFTEGPLVQASYKAEPPKAKKPFPWWIAVIAAIVLIGAGVTFKLLFDKDPAKEVAVPALTGLKLSEAEAELKKTGLEWTVSDRDSLAKTPGTVLGQNPAPDAKIKTDKAVALVVARLPTPKISTVGVELLGTTVVDLDTGKVQTNSTLPDADLFVSKVFKRVAPLGKAKMGVADTKDPVGCATRTDLHAKDGNYAEDLASSLKLCIDTGDGAVAIVDFKNVGGLYSDGTVETTVWQRPVPPKLKLPQK